VSGGMFRLPDQAALDAMLKRTYVRVVKPMEVKPMEVKPNTPPAKPVLGEGANEPGRRAHLDDKPSPKPKLDTGRVLRRPPKERIDYVGRLVRQMCLAGLPTPTREFAFAKDIGRRWRIDIAYPDIKLAIEVDGMAHRTRERFMSDIGKHNELAFRGWRLVRIYTRWIANERHEFDIGIELVKRALAAGGEK